VSRGLKFHWLAWFVLALIVAAGTEAFFVSTRVAEVDLTLASNSTAELSVVRLFPTAVGFELAFERQGRSQRPELGTYSTHGGWSEGYVQFLDPGTPIKIQVSVNDNPTGYMFEATPTSGRSQTRFYRSLLPFLADGDLQHYPWPPPPSGLVVSRGTSHLHISVLDVGEPLLGEKVSLFAPSPVGFKVTSQGYRAIWLFFFWPVYASLLAIYGLILLVCTVRRHRPAQ